MTKGSRNPSLISIIKSERGGGTTVQMLAIAIGLIVLMYIIADYTQVHLTRRRAMSGADAGAAAGADAIVAVLNVNENEKFEGRCPERCGYYPHYYICSRQDSPPIKIGPYMPPELIVKEYYEEIYFPLIEDPSDAKSEAVRYVQWNKSSQYKPVQVRSGYFFKSRILQGYRFDSFIMEVSSKKDTPIDLISGITEVHGRAGSIIYLQTQPFLDEYYKCGIITLYKLVCTKAGCYWVPYQVDVFTQDIILDWTSGLYSPDQ